jgi:spore maturation protein CgeB
MPLQGVFRAGEDLLFAENGAEMTHHLNTLLTRPKLARSLARNGLQTIRRNHTCRHRVEELLNIPGCSEARSF